jgi:hypothetical protein
MKPAIWSSGVKASDLRRASHKKILFGTTRLSDMHVYGQEALGLSRWSIRYLKWRGFKQLTRFS